MNDAMLTGWLWTLPIVGAIVGYGTNWVAVRMLFKPKEPVRVGPITIQGLIPKNKQYVAETIGHVIENYLLRTEDVIQVLNDPDIQTKIREHLNESFRRMSLDLVPDYFRAFATPDVLDGIRERVIERVMAGIPEIVDGLRTDLKDSHQLRRVIEARVNDFDVNKLNTMIEMISSTGFRRIEILGGLLGGMIGLAQWAVLGLIG